MPGPVLTVQATREWETASWRAGKLQARVIAEAGRCLARQALDMTTAGDLIILLCGKGHNGDDVRAAKKNLTHRRVKVLSVTDPKKSYTEISRLTDSGAKLIVDGLFGIGLNRPLDAAWQKLIQTINATQIDILAADVPSGLNAGTGGIEGAAIKATVTVTLGAIKHGMLEPKASAFIGKLILAPEIGLIESPESEMTWTLASDFNHYPPPRSTQANKGDFGRVNIIAGSEGYHGAAVLSSHGAQRAQPGLITVYTPKESYLAVAAQSQAVMVHPWKRGWTLPENTDALLIGPGMAAKNLPNEIKVTTRKLWLKAEIPMLVDASALDWLVPGKLKTQSIRVLTPHPGEAARLLKTTAKEIQKDRVGALRKISHQFGNCWVILKGANTLIGRSTGKISVNSSGNPFLAQGGSGDLLGGYLAGLLAQSALQENPAKTLAYGVWRHGAAADHLSQTRPNWVIEDLAAALGNFRGASKPPVSHDQFISHRR